MLAAFDHACSPPTYDFVSFLVGLEMERMARGDDTVQIGILPGPMGGFRADNLPPFSLDERVAMRDRIVVPMARLLPSCSECVVCTDRNWPPPGSYGYGQQRYGFHMKMEAARANVYPLRCPEPVSRMEDYITITLREASYWPTRNSNVTEWIKVAQQLMRQGHQIVVVRDTAKADESLPGIETAPRASHALPARARLYAGARLNLFINNGPAWLCWFMGLPTLICKMTSPEAPVVHDQFFASYGLPRGAQMPNARPRQRILWSDDDHRPILDAVEEMIGVPAFA